MARMVTAANRPTTSASRGQPSRFVACHSSPVKKKKSVTKSSIGSARPCSRTLLLMSYTAYRTARRSNAPTP